MAAFTIIEFPATLPMSARVRGRNVRQLLRQLEIRWMWDHKKSCYLVSRQSADDIAAWLECHKLPVWVEETDL